MANVQKATGHGHFLEMKNGRTIVTMISPVTK